VGFAPTEKRRLCTAHAKMRHYPISCEGLSCSKSLHSHTAIRTHTFGHELSFATLLSNGSYRRHQQTAGGKIIQVQCAANALDQRDCTDIFVGI